MKQHLTNKKALELGRTLERFYDMGYVKPKEALLFSFAKGVVTGAGAFLGGTLIIGLLLWLLSLFDSVPFIDEIRNVLQTSE
jgi:hypothetical protein